MKIKLSLLPVLIAMASSANAASVYVTNLVEGTAAADALFENVNGTLVSGGILAMGYFGSNNPSGDIANIAATIADFTVLSTGTTIATAAIGGPLPSLEEANYPGYAESEAFYIGDSLTDNSENNKVGASNPLINKKVYAFVGNQSQLSLSTAFALYYIDTIEVDPDIGYQSFDARAKNATLVIGSTDSITAYSPADEELQTYQTIKLVPVPEPSAALLGAVGALGLLRRRRN